MIIINISYNRLNRSSTCTPVSTSAIHSPHKLAAKKKSTSKVSFSRSAEKLSFFEIHAPSPKRKQKLAALVSYHHVAVMSYSFSHTYTHTKAPAKNMLYLRAKKKNSHPFGGIVFFFDCFFFFVVVLCNIVHFLALKYI